MNPLIAEALSTMKLWGHLSPYFPDVSPVVWNDKSLNVDIWLWISGWHHPVPLRSDRSGIAICFCLGLIEQKPIVPGATAVYLSYAEGISKKSLQGLPADIVRRLLQDMEDARNELSNADNAPLTAKNGKRLEAVFRRLVARKHGSALTRALKAHPGTPVLGASGKQYPLRLKNSRIGPIADIEQFKEAFFPEFWPSPTAPGESSDTRPAVLNCLGHGERIKQRALVRVLTLAPYGWTLRDARRQVSLIIEEREVSQREDEVFVGDYEQTWTRQSVLAKVRKLKNRSSKSIYLSLETLEFIEFVFASHTSLATASAVAGKLLLDVASILDVLDERESFAARTLFAELEPLFVRVMHLFIVASVGGQSYQDCIAESQRLIYKLRKLINTRGNRVKQSTSITPEITRDVEKILAGNNSSTSPIDTDHLTGSLVVILELEEQYCYFAEPGDGLYIRDRKLIWGGKAYTDLKPKMIQLLDFLLARYRSGRAFVKAKEVKEHLGKGYEYGLKKTFELGKAKGVDRHHPVHKTICFHRNGAELIAPFED